MIEYVTEDGDMIDRLCFKRYGFIDGALLRVLAENPGLANLGEVLPYGIRIIFPDLTEEPKEELRVWD